MCLSCHDGTIALTQTYNSNNALPGSVYITPQDRGYIGTDLTDDHPISFTYDAALAAKNTQLNDPASIPKALPLDQNRQLQCTTCHDAHDNRHGSFLVMANARSQMCVSWCIRRQPLFISTRSMRRIWKIPESMAFLFIFRLKALSPITSSMMAID